MTRTWIGSAAPVAPGDTHLDLGPEHPTRAGALALDLADDGAVVTSATVQTGFSHRGAEKLFEVRDYRQGLALANRHEWQSAISGELALVLLVEEALGIDCSERTTWLRMLAAEHARIHAQLACLGWLLADDPALAARGSALRERLREQLAAWTGSRLHPMLVRIGGVAADVDDAWLAHEADLAAEALGIAVDARHLLAAREDLRGLGVLDARAVASWGLSGCTARAAGIAADVRREDPYLAYAELTRDLSPVQSAGDAHDRFAAMVADLRVAASVVLDCVGHLAGTTGEIETRLPKIIRLPEGEWYRAVEGAFGEAGVRIVSRGEKTPWRVALRTASLPQTQALPAALVGTPTALVEAVVASLPWVIGDVDK